MSRPYFNINNLTYAGPTLSFDFSYFKLRSTATTATFSVDGFSNSIVISVTNSNSYQGLFTFGTPNIGDDLPNDNIKVRLGSLGTSSTTTYTQPTLTYTFTGTVSATTNLTMNLRGVNIVNLTAVSALGGSTSTQFLATTTFSFTGAAANFTGTVSGSSLIFTAPTNTGNLYNGATISTTITQGGSSFATSSGGTTFSGGLNNYTLVVNYAPLGPVTGGNEVYLWSIN